MCSESCDLFRLWEICDNNSEMVKDSDIVLMEHKQEIVCGLTNATIANALE